MKIVGVAACTSGIAHTYIAREKLLSAGRELGHDIYVETQGTIGTENGLTSEQIKNADVVIIATDIKIGGMERFKGKNIVEVGTSVVIKSPKALIKNIEEQIK